MMDGLKKLELNRTAAPLREQVLQQLRTEIIEGRLAPGHRLIEREMTAMLGVSRTVLRESVRQLEAEGLVSLIPNKGLVVRALTVEEAQELYRIREALEGLAARLSAERGGHGLVVELERAYGAVKAAYGDGDPRRVLQAKNDFYQVMHAGARSRILSKMLGTVLAQIWRWRAMGLAHPMRSPGRSAESLRNLRAVIDAVKDDDPHSAEHAAREDVRLAAAEVMRILGAARTDDGGSTSDWVAPDPD